MRMFRRKANTNAINPPTKPPHTHITSGVSNSTTMSPITTNQDNNNAHANFHLTNRPFQYGEDQNDLLLINLSTQYYTQDTKSSTIPPGLGFGSPLTVSDPHLSISNDRIELLQSTNDLYKYPYIHDISPIFRNIPAYINLVLDLAPFIPPSTLSPFPHANLPMYSDILDLSSREIKLSTDTLIFLGQSTEAPFANIIPKPILSSESSPVGQSILSSSISSQSSSHPTVTRVSSPPTSTLPDGYLSPKHAPTPTLAPQSLSQSVQPQPGTHQQPTTKNNAQDSSTLKFSSWTSASLCFTPGFIRQSQLYYLFLIQLYAPDAGSNATHPRALVMPVGQPLHRLLNPSFIQNNPYFRYCSQNGLIHSKMFPETFQQERMKLELRRLQPCSHQQNQEHIRSRSSKSSLANSGFRKIYDAIDEPSLSPQVDWLSHLDHSISRFIPSFSPGTKSPKQKLDLNQQIAFLIASLKNRNIPGLMPTGTVPTQSQTPNMIPATLPPFQALSNAIHTHSVEKIHRDDFYSMIQDDSLNSSHSHKTTPQPFFYTSSLTALLTPLNDLIAHLDLHISALLLGLSTRWQNSAELLASLPISHPRQFDFTPIDPCDHDNFLHLFNGFNEPREFHDLAWGRECIQFTPPPQHPATLSSQYKVEPQSTASHFSYPRPTINPTLRPPTLKRITLVAIHGWKLLIGFMADHSGKPISDQLLHQALLGIKETILNQVIIDAIKVHDRYYNVETIFPPQREANYQRLHSNEEPTPRHQPLQFTLSAILPSLNSIIYHLGIEINLIPLYSYGTISQRTQEYSQTILPSKHNLLKTSDIVYFIAHSQGSIIGANLLTNLIETKVLDPKKNFVQFLTIAGVIHGPWNDIPSDMMPATRELFRLAQSTSSVQKKTAQNFAFLKSNGVHCVHVGAWGDAVVPLHSSLHLLPPYPDEDGRLPYSNHSAVDRGGSRRDTLGTRHSQFNEQPLESSSNCEIEFCRPPKQPTPAFRVIVFDRAKKALGSVASLHTQGAVGLPNPSTPIIDSAPVSDSSSPPPIQVCPLASGETRVQKLFNIFDYSPHSQLLSHLSSNPFIVLSLVALSAINTLTKVKIPTPYTSNPTTNTHPSRQPALAPLTSTPLLHFLDSISSSTKQYYLTTLKQIITFKSLLTTHLVAAQHVIISLGLTARANLFGASLYHSDVKESQDVFKFSAEYMFYQFAQFQSSKYLDDIKELEFNLQKSHSDPKLPLCQFDWKTYFSTNSIHISYESLLNETITIPTLSGSTNPGLNSSSPSPDNTQIRTIDPNIPLPVPSSLNDVFQDEDTDPILPHDVNPPISRADLPHARRFSSSPFSTVPNGTKANVNNGQQSILGDVAQNKGDKISPEQLSLRDGFLKTLQKKEKMSSTPIILNDKASSIPFTFPFVPTLAVDSTTLKGCSTPSQNHPATPRHQPPLHMVESFAHNASFDDHLTLLSASSALDVLSYILHVNQPRAAIASGNLAIGQLTQYHCLPATPTTSPPNPPIFCDFAPPSTIASSNIPSAKAQFNIHDLNWLNQFHYPHHTPFTTANLPAISHQDFAFSSHHHIAIASTAFSTLIQSFLALFRLNLQSIQLTQMSCDHSAIPSVTGILLDVNTPLPTHRQTFNFFSPPVILMTPTTPESSSIAPLSQPKSTTQFSIQYLPSTRLFTPSPATLSSYFAIAPIISPLFYRHTLLKTVLIPLRDHVKAISCYVSQLSLEKTDPPQPQTSTKPLSRHSSMVDQFAHIVAQLNLLLREVQNRLLCATSFCSRDLRTLSICSQLVQNATQSLLSVAYTRSLLDSLSNHYYSLISTETIEPIYSINSHYNHRFLELLPALLPHHNSSERPSSFEKCDAPLIIQASLFCAFRLQGLSVLQSRLRQQLKPNAQNPSNFGSLAPTYIHRGDKAAPGREIDHWSPANPDPIFSLQSKHPTLSTSQLNSPPGRQLHLINTLIDLYADCFRSLRQTIELSSSFNEQLEAILQRQLNNTQTNLSIFSLLTSTTLSTLQNTSQFPQSSLNNVNIISFDLLSLPSPSTLIPPTNSSLGMAVKSYDHPVSAFERQALGMLQILTLSLQGVNQMIETSDSISTNDPENNHNSDAFSSGNGDLRAKDIPFACQPENCGLPTFAPVPPPPSIANLPLLTRPTIQSTITRAFKSDLSLHNELMATVEFKLNSLSLSGIHKLTQQLTDVTLSNVNITMATLRSAECMLGPIIVTLSPRLQQLWSASSIPDNQILLERENRNKKNISHPFDSISSTQLLVNALKTPLSIIQIAQQMAIEIALTDNAIYHLIDFLCGLVIETTTSDQLTHIDSFKEALTAALENEIIVISQATSTPSLPTFKPTGSPPTSRIILTSTPLTFFFPFPNALLEMKSHFNDDRAYAYSHPQFIILVHFFTRLVICSIQSYLGSILFRILSKQGEDQLDCDVIKQTHLGSIEWCMGSDFNPSSVPCLTTSSSTHSLSNILLANCSLPCQWESDESRLTLFSYFDKFLDHENQPSIIFPIPLNFCLTDGSNLPNLFSPHSNNDLSPLNQLIHPTPWQENYLTTALFDDISPLPLKTQPSFPGNERSSPYSSFTHWISSWFKSLAVSSSPPCQSNEDLSIKRGLPKTTGEIIKTLIAQQFSDYSKRVDGDTSSDTQPSFVDLWDVFVLQPTVGLPTHMNRSPSLPNSSSKNKSLYAHTFQEFSLPERDYDNDDYHADQSDLYSLNNQEIITPQSSPANPHQSTTNGPSNHDKTPSPFFENGISEPPQSVPTPITVSSSHNTNNPPTDFGPLSWGHSIRSIYNSFWGTSSVNTTDDPHQRQPQRINSAQVGPRVTSAIRYARL